MGVLVLIFLGWTASRFGRPFVFAGGWALFWVGFFTVFTYLNAGWLREQVCIYMCPYARFQSVMFDKDTLVVSYDQARGEPRGARKRTADPRAEGLGDCIDCAAGTYVETAGSSEGIFCIACAAGKYSTASAVEARAAQASWLAPES